MRGCSDSTCEANAPGLENKPFPHPFHVCTQLHKWNQHSTRAAQRCSTRLPPTMDTINTIRARDRAAALALIAQLHRQGRAGRYIARALDIAGIPTLCGRPGARWRHQAVSRLIPIAMHAEQRHTAAAA